MGELRSAKFAYVNHWIKRGSSDCGFLSTVKRISYAGKAIIMQAA